MKFIKFLSLITLIICAPALYSMENNALQEQSRVPKLIDLCLPRAIEQINAIINEQCTKLNTYQEAVELLKEIEDTFHVSNFIDQGLIDKLYRSNEVFQHCIDLIINEIWNQCQDVTGATLDTIMHEIRQNLLSKISKELLSFIEAHFCKQKGWHVPYCLKEFDNIDQVAFFPGSSLLFVRYRNNNGNTRGELIDTKTGRVIKEFNNINWVYPSPNGSLVKYVNGRGELIDAKSGAVIKDNALRVYFSPNGSLMVVYYLREDRGELIDVKTGKVIKDNVDGVYFSPNGSLMFVRYFRRGRGELIEVKSGAVIKELNNVDEVNFSPDGSFMVVRYFRGGRGELIDAKSGAVIKDNVLRVNFSPDGSLMFVRYFRGRGELIEVKSGAVIKELNNVDEVNFSPDASFMVVKYMTCRRELINTKTGKVIKDNVDKVNFSPNGSLMFVKYIRNYRGELIDAKSGAVIKDNVSYFSPNGSLMFVQYGDGRKELMNIKTRSVIKTFNNVYGVSFSPNGSLLFVRYYGNNSNRGELIDAKSGTAIKEFDNVSLVKFSPNDSLMFVKYEKRVGLSPVNSRGELLCKGNFEQIIFKCALRNTLQTHKEQQSDEIKQGLTTLLNHQILKTFPQQVQEQLSKNMGLEFKDLAGILLNNPQSKRGVVRRI